MANRVYVGIMDNQTDKKMEKPSSNVQACLNLSDFYACTACKGPKSWSSLIPQYSGFRAQGFWAHSSTLRGGGFKMKGVRACGLET